MRLVTYRPSAGGERPGALLLDDSVVDLDVLGRDVGLAFTGVRDLIALGETARRPLVDRLEQVATNPAPGIESGWIHSLHEVELLPPTGSRPFVLGCGGIFVSHLIEMGVNPPLPNPQPDGFIVNPNIVVGSEHPIVLPAFAPDRVDYEGEFCVVFGKPTYNVSTEDALDHVAGYTIYNDVSARNPNPGFTSADPAERVAAFGGIIRYKGFPTFGPLGPAIATSDEFEDVEKSRLITTVNGEVMQDDLVGNLGFSIAEVIARVTRFHSFEAGDVMTLGTPAGVGYGRSPQVFLKPGDVVEVSVEGIGTLRNPVVAATN